MFKVFTSGCASVLIVLTGASCSNSQAATLCPVLVPTDTLPGISELRGGGVVTGMNDVGQFVGIFGERNGTILGMPHGYIYNFRNGDTSYGHGWESRTNTASGEDVRLGTLGGYIYQDQNFRYLDIDPRPGSQFNDRFFSPAGINNNNFVVGKMTSDSFGSDPSQAVIFDLNSLAMQVIQITGSLSAEAVDINDIGTVVGNFFDGQHVHGFQFRDGLVTIIKAPWANVGTSVAGINDDGYVVGKARFGGDGFIWKDGIFERLNFDQFSPSDINNAKQVVGTTSALGQRQGFLYENGVGYTFGPQGTFANTINNLGQIGGQSGNRGFLTTVNEVKGVTSTVPEQASWAMLIAGFGMTGAAMRRRRRLIVG